MEVSSLGEVLEVEGDRTEKKDKDRSGVSNRQPTETNDLRTFRGGLGLLTRCEKGGTKP